MADTSQTPRSDSGSGNDEIREQLQTLRSDLSDLSDTVRKQARKGLDEAQERAAERVEDIEGQIRRNPIQSTAIAAGIGFLLGAILSR